MGDDEQLDPIEKFRCEVAAWAGSASASPADSLIRWLQGFRLPYGGMEDEPYVWLLRAVETTPDDGLRAPLAQRLAALLEQSRIEDWKHEPWPDRLRYNFLMLCAGLEAPDHLCEPLAAIYQRRELQGDWHGMDSRDALRVALIHNQIDDRFRDKWLALTENKPGWLRGNVYDGLEGVARIPCTCRELALPQYLGEAIRHFAAYFADDPNRAEKVQAFFRRMSVLHGNQDMDAQLVELAATSHWPKWLGDCFWPILEGARSEKGTEHEYFIDAKIYLVLKECFPREHFEHCWSPFFWKLKTANEQLKKLLEDTNKEMLAVTPRSSLPIDDRKKEGLCQAALSAVSLEMPLAERNDFDRARGKSLPEGQQRCVAAQMDALVESR